ncbi:hypothetical protein BMW23_0551 [Bodo saltans virus]|uniref:Uncharacterized protein n=1 Tax=Bodo saltans virus TaxID=2024608 RepID=A0A2H4UUL0_9VIRU|nr:hypothetical protein QJ851_gp0535 [Bodo saltans virus]ATZ80598.1 hypothetical protein BMW23_0551 [Bodo saltans virus]
MCKNIKNIIYCKNIMNNIHVISVISNPCEYNVRWKLMNEFIERMQQTENIILYIVEMVYKNQDFTITNSNNKNHLQLRCEHILWHKENMINLGVKQLLPYDWKYMAWIDGDIEFLNENWVNDTIKELQKNDIVQLFETCDDLDKNMIPMYIHKSFGEQWNKSDKHKKALQKELIQPDHPGYAWACTREFYDKIGGIYDRSIIGYGDRIIAYAIIQSFKNMYYDELENANNDALEYMKKFIGVRFGYIKGKILHHFHGKKENRQYDKRKFIMREHKFDPYTQIKYNDEGIIVPTDKMNNSFIEELIEFFKQRKEDNI